MAIAHQVHLTANNTPVNGPSKTGNPSGGGRGNNPTNKCSCARLGDLMH